MKKIVFAMFCLSLAITTTQAQSFDWGIRGGVSTPDVKPADLMGIRYKSGSDSLVLKVQDADYGFNFGLWGRAKFGKFFVQPEVVFNSNSVTYQINKTAGAVVQDAIKEKYNRVDVPILLGYKMSSFRINAGAVGHFDISSKSDLATVSGFTTKFKTATWGYQAGIGLDFGRLGIDLRYEGNFDEFGNHINIGTTEYQFDKAASRLIVSAAISF